MNVIIFITDGSLTPQNENSKATAKLIITALLLSHNNISASHTSLLQVYRRLVWPADILF